MSSTERRAAAAWPDFLRRTLLTVSLASAAAVQVAPPEEPQREIAEADAEQPARS